MTTPNNPLFPTGQDADIPQAGSAGYLLPGKSSGITPPSGNDSGVNPAVNLIKQKLAQLYDQTEPNARVEARVAESATVRSPHQQFMHELTTSGKSLAEIQTAWHNYYTSLPDDQKHQVWQEFYNTNNGSNLYQPAPAATTQPSTAAPATHPNGAVVADHTPALPTKPARTPREIKTGIHHRVRRRAAQLGAAQKQNLHSLLFGLSTGVVVIVIFMFGFFNEVIIAPFIQPGRANSAPVILDNNSIASSGKSEVIIPKINLEIPVVYNLASNDESVIQTGLEQGVVHYPSTEVPGEKGNVALFGHSSYNIFNKGKYKFAFVLLHEIRKDDTFYLTYGKQVYAYKVISRKVVDPSEVGVLNDIPGQTATATLITCDPPGTSSHRLVVVGKQISPNPTSNTASSTEVDHSQSTTPKLVGNGPTLWSRFWHWLF